MKIELLTKNYEDNNRFPLRVKFLNNAVKVYRKELDCIISALEKEVEKCNTSIEVYVPENYNKSVTGLFAALRMLGYAVIYVKDGDEYKKRESVEIFDCNDSLIVYKFIVSIQSKTDEKEMESFPYIEPKAEKRSIFDYFQKPYIMGRPPRNK